MTSTMQGLRGIRVIDFSGHDGSRWISGHYASKMLVDVGAEVIKVESSDGDILRHWSASNGHVEEDGAFFRFLNAGKQSIVAAPDDDAILKLLATADLVIDACDSVSASHQIIDRLNLCERFPGLVVLSISPYGRTGPYANDRATEFTIQADSGALGMRGQRDREPLMAGAKTTEYVGGTFAAVAALAAVMRAKTTGMGEFIDFSLFEISNLSGTSYSDMMSSLWGRPPLKGAVRSFESPSIEPTKDGWVGFATNSYQQYSDFLVMIGRTDLLEQKDLAMATGRSKRMVEWSAIVHGWMKAHTTEEVLELAALLRIPVAPLGNGKLVFEHPQLQARKVFVENPCGKNHSQPFLQPRPPCLYNGQSLFPLRPAPALNEHSANLSSDRGVARNVPGIAPTQIKTPELPLKGIRVFDATAWWAGPAATQMLAHLGAEVIHVESIQRLDGSRMMGGEHVGKSNWVEYSSMFLSANSNKRGITLNLEDPDGVAIAKQLIAECDIFVENFSPRVIKKFGLDWETVRALNPKLIMIRMPAFGLDGPWRDHVGFAQTMEQISGLAWVTGYVDDQPRIQRGPCDPMAGMNAAFAALVALQERAVTGEGALIECSMVEGALNAAAEQIVEYSAYGNILQRMGNRSADAAPQGVYYCKDHEKKNEQWLALSIETQAQWLALCEAMADVELANDPALQTLAGRVANHDRIDQRVQAYLAAQPLEETLAQWRERGIPVAPVRSNVRVVQHPQVLARGFYQELTHPVVGTHLHVTVPFTFQSQQQHQLPWLRNPAPTLGADNVQVLKGILGLDEQRIEALKAKGVIGDALPSTQKNNLA